jgi:hypothetical protein
VEELVKMEMVLREGTAKEVNLGQGQQKVHPEVNLSFGQDTTEGITGTSRGTSGGRKPSR